MARYKMAEDGLSVYDKEKKRWVPQGHSDWYDYINWSGLGNTPDPADPIVVTVDMIKTEAGLRILEKYPQWKQANMTARMVELNKIRASVGSWTAGEQIEVDVIQSAWDWVKSVRSASDALELTLPVDYNNNNNLYWPES